MQDPNEDTEWNDVLRSKGIIPPKPQKVPEFTEEQIQAMMDDAIERRTDLQVGEGQRTKKMEQMSVDELDELEDSEDEAVLNQYRQKRMAEMREQAKKAKFGSVREIPGQDYVAEVTKAGKDIWVVLHLYANGVPLCARIHHYMQQLAERYPQTKFLRSIGTTCIPDFPESKVPTVLVYYEGELKKQYVGSLNLRGEKLTVDELEFMLGQAGAVPTEIEDDPRPQIRDKMFADLQN